MDGQCPFFDLYDADRLLLVFVCHGKDTQGWKKTQQEDHPLTVYMLDVNSFKLINDNYGHAEGDHALMAVAESLMILARDYHLFVSGYGGDEFTIVDYGEVSNEPEKIVESFCKLLKMKCEEKELP